MGEKVFVSWSGGKDSYLSLLKAKEEGLDIQYLLNFIGHHGRSMSHGLSEEILREQAEALGIHLVMEKVSWGSYEEGFRRVAGKLKGKGVMGGVFGDINIEAHREWVEKMCAGLGLTAYLPLWGMEEEAVVAELIERGARLLIVSLDKTALPQQWLGNEIDNKFLIACREAGISPCGEKGEYHTMVVGGPLFANSLELVKQGSYEADNKYFLKLIR